MSTRPSTSFLLILQMESLELDANISPMHSQHQPKWGTRPPATGSVSGSSVRIGWSVSPGSRTSCAGGLGRTNAYSLPLSMALGIPAIPAGMTSGGRQTSPLKNYPLPLRCPHKPAAAQRAHNFLYSPRPRSVTGRARCARSRSPSRTVSSARWVYQPSGTGWCGRQQPWCRRRSLRLTCNRSSRPTGRAATLPRNGRAGHGGDASDDGAAQADGRRREDQALPDSARALRLPRVYLRAMLLNEDGAGRHRHATSA